MSFAAPLALLGLLALPAIFLLLRQNPPAARRIRFPPLALLRDIAIPAPSPCHMPLWLLILRLTAAGFVIVGLAGPSLHPPPPLPGTGPILLVIDNGWAAAADWPLRRAAAQRLVAAAGLTHRPVALLATAADAAGSAPHLTGLMTAAAATQILDTLQPEPWPSDRAAAAAALAAAPSSTRLYIADGITDGPGFPLFLKRLAPNRSLVAAIPPALLLAATPDVAGLAVHAANAAGTEVVARTSAGAVLGSAVLSASGVAQIVLPPALAGQLATLVLAGPASAAGTLLLDGSSRAAFVGVAAGGGAADTPFLGSLYFIRRALPPGTRIVTGTFAALIAANPGLIILADLPLDASRRTAAARYITHGGVLIHFAGPVTAALPDALSPEPLLAGDRRLGGALTWSTSQRFEAFPAGSPFTGLATDPTVTVSRQLLADPTRLDPATVWARLQDGTPVVLGKSIGTGTLVSVLTSANADWSDLALSGLYPAMLGRLALLATGAATRPNTALPLRLQLSAQGALAPPTTQATLTGAQLANATVSPAAPAGLYGLENTSIALNLGDHVPLPLPVVLPHATRLRDMPPPADLGTGLVVCALLLLLIDMAVSLRRRRLLAWRLAAVTFVAVAFGSIPAANAEVPPAAALQTSLGFIRVGNPAIDQLSADGLAYLSASVSAHTSANLSAPAALDPATDDLADYPLIYWPILATAPAPGSAACAALNRYTSHGGLLLIDTAGGDAGAPGSGAGFAVGAADALARATACLDLPPLQPLTPTDVLAHCFYILHDFPGRFTGASVLVATPGGRDDDGVTPVIIGQNGWAGAWARDADGQPEQLPLPGGDDQRRQADRFGTNLVIYALTGSYKGSQTNIVPFLEQLGP